MSTEQTDADLKKLCEKMLALRADLRSNKLKPLQLGYTDFAREHGPTLARELLSRLEAEAWRDISTAPKDGTAILALHSTVECPDYQTVVHWDGPPDHPWSDNEGTLSWREDYFTYWQPLPTPPERRHG